MYRNIDEPFRFNASLQHTLVTLVLIANTFFNIYFSLISLLFSTSHPFKWSSSAAEAFESLIRAFTSAPILIHANQDKPFILEVHASDFALGSVLSQPNGLLYPVAFHSRKFEAAEINYEIHDKELLAIVDSFEHCWPVRSGRTSGKAESDRIV